MRTIVSSVPSFVSLFALAACGGPLPTRTPAASVPSTTGEPATASAPVSIGDVAAREGGLTALGGGRNRDTSGGFESAMMGPLIAEQLDKSFPVKFDGVLREWHGRVQAKTVISGNGDAAGLAAAIQYDESKIYLGVEVIDPRFSRTSQYKETEDHATFLIAFPTPSGPKGYQVGLFAGKPGELRGIVKWLSGPQKGKEIAGTKIVEAPTSSGYTFEAVVPWSAFPEAQSIRVGLRGQLRYSDMGSSNVISTGPGDSATPSTWSPLPTSPERAVIEGLLAPKGMTSQVPRMDLYADVGGDGMKERISIFDRYLTICGPGYRGGNQFYFRELAGDLSRIDAQDLTGRAKEELVLRQTIKNGDLARERLEVWSVGNDEPTTLFSHEIAISSGHKRLSNSVRLGRKEIEVSTEPAKEWDATTFRDATDADGALLLPWGSVKSRTYKFDGTRFSPASEVTQKATGQTTIVASKPAELAPPKDLPTPEVKKNTDLSHQVFEQYKKDRNVPDSLKPKTDLQVQVDGDARPERAVLIGKDLVVFGPGFAGGNRYAFLTLAQFADANDIQELTARDMTGSGRANLVVRGSSYVSAQTGAPVRVDLLVVYAVNDGSISRVFAIETGRQQGDKRVQGLVQFIPSRSGRGFDIDASAGIAKGWTKDSYPWHEDSNANNSSSIEPLVFPWSATKSVRYTWNGKEFAR